MRYLIINAETRTGGGLADGFRRPAAGFIDAAARVRIAGIDSDSEPTVPRTPCPNQIGVDYYLENDLRKANYLQRKLNSLTVRSLDAQSVTRWQPARQDINRRVREEVEKLSQYENTYISTMVQQSQKSQKRIQECVLADLNRQEESLQTRKLRRIRSGQL